MLGEPGEVDEGVQSWTGPTSLNGIVNFVVIIVYTGYIIYCVISMPKMILQSSGTTLYVIAFPSLIH